MSTSKVEIRQFLLRYPLTEQQKLETQTLNSGKLQTYFVRNKIDFIYAVHDGDDHDKVRKELEDYLVQLAKSRWPEYVHPTPL